MKKLILLFLLITTGLTLTSAQGLHLNIDDEFEYRNSSFTTTETEKQLNQVSSSEVLVQDIYKFKVISKNKKTHTLICNYSRIKQYSRVKLPNKNWVTASNNNKELRYSHTPSYKILDCKLKVSVSNEGTIDNISIIDYEKQANNKMFIPKEENIIKHHKKALAMIFFAKPILNKDGEDKRINNTLFKLQSKTVNSLSYSTVQNDTYERKDTTRFFPRGKEITTYYNGNTKSTSTLLCDRKSGLIKEIIYTIKDEAIINHNVALTQSSESTYRSVLIPKKEEPSECVFFEDGKKYSAIIKNTNVRIRGKITPKNNQRYANITWTEKWPSGTKNMGIMAPLSKNNTFDLKLNIDKPRRIEINQHFNTVFFILPGDNIYIDLSKDITEENPRATGVGAAHVNFCIDQKSPRNKGRMTKEDIDKIVNHKRHTIPPSTYKSQVLSQLKKEQDYLISKKKGISPEIYLSLFWENQLKAAEELYSYSRSTNYKREKEKLPKYDIDWTNYGHLDSLIHADNDMMAFADDYDRYISNYVFTYLQDKMNSYSGQGRTINTYNYLNTIYTNRYNFANLFFTGKTQEALKYHTIISAKKQSESEAYLELLTRFKDDFPHSSKLQLLEEIQNGSDSTDLLNQAYDFRLKDTNGKQHQLSDYKGKAIYLSFWSLDCASDKYLEMRANKLEKAYQDSNIVFLHILFGEKKLAIKHIKAHHKKGIFLLANGQSEILIRQEYPFNTFPHYYTIDTNGNIVSNHNNAPYQIFNNPDILTEAFYPSTRSINYQERSRRMIILSVILVSLLLVAGMTFLFTKVRSSRKLKLVNLNQQLHESELKAIRAQMNPHFIHNCLNSIQNLVQKKENEKAHLYISKFATLIRDTLTLSNKQEIPLSQEIEMLSNYITLEELRFDIDFKLSIAPEIDIYSIFIPPMLLQPIIENAILHGLAPITGEKTLSLSIYKCEKLICIEIQDNGIGRVSSQETQTKGTGKGTSFTNERLQLMSEKTKSFCEMSISDLQDDHQQPCGTKVIIKIEEED